MHEDVGFVSRDRDTYRGSFVFRHFLSEGFMNTFDITPKQEEHPAIMFGYRGSESAGGMRVQMRPPF